MLLLVRGWQAVFPSFRDLARLVYLLSSGPLFLLRGQVPMPAPDWRSFVLWLRVPIGNRPLTYGSLLGHSVSSPSPPAHS